MTNPTDDENEIAANRAQKGGKGESDGSFGGGKAGAGAGVGFMLSTKKNDHVKGEHRHMVGAELVEALVEFCKDGAMRASANLTVVWNKSFAHINSFLTYCQKELPRLAQNLQRGAGRDSKGLQRQKPKAPAAGLSMAPNGPNGPTGQ